LNHIGNDLHRIRTQQLPDLGFWYQGIWTWGRPMLLRYQRHFSSIPGA